MSELDPAGRLQWLAPDDDSTPFWSPERALREPDGLLAVGGALSPRRLLEAYRRGIFPWYTEGQPVLWWSPDPRTVLFPERLHVSRSLRKTLRRGRFRVSFDRAFDAVIAACAEPRRGEPGTWLTPAMQAAYRRLHREHRAHSVEVWEDGPEGSTSEGSTPEGSTLVGGLYGVAIGRVFYGESMFSRRSDASKVALVHLVGRLRAWGYRLIDCQVDSPHLRRLGAEPIPRRRFLALLERWCPQPGREGSWRGAEEEAP
ncbi:MAG: leucyl/phenylalanyl-tRNA--protein transferase [Gammaproteobacteria bacterium]|nr:MAG: leucyl/phenylalanyl-tRNA--protein transferase [Gammaproteobacteria bacterium]